MEFRDFAAQETSALIGRLLASQADAQIRGLREALEAAARAVDAAAAAKPKADDDVKELVQRLTAAAGAAVQRVQQEARQATDAARQELEAERGQREQLAAAFANAEARARALSEDLARQTERADAGDRDLDATIEAHKQIEGELVELRLLLDKTAADAARYAGELESEAAQSAILREEVTVARETAAGLESALGRAEAALAAAEASLGDEVSAKHALSGERDALQAERDELRRDLDAARAQSSEAGSELDALRGRMDAALAHVESMTSERERTNAALVAATTERAAMAEQLASTIGERNAAREGLDAMRGERDTVATQHAVVRKDREALTEQLDTARAEIATLSAQLTAVRGELKTAAADLGTARAQAEALASERDSHRSAADADVGAAHAQITDLTANAARMSSLFDASLRAVDALGAAPAVNDLLAALVQQVAGEFPRVAIFRAHANHLEGEHHVGFDATDVSKLVIPLNLDSLITRAAASGSVERMTAADLAKGAALPFGGSPALAMAIPIAYQGETLAILYADSDHASGGAPSAYAELLVRHTVVLLARLSQELKTLKELRDYAVMLLQEAEQMYAADMEAGKAEKDRRRRLQETVDCARQLYAQRAALEGASAAGLLDEQITSVIQAQPVSGFARELAVVTGLKQSSKRNAS